MNDNNTIDINQSMIDISNNNDKELHNEATSDEKWCYNGKEMMIIANEWTTDQKATSNSNACSNNDPSNCNDTNDKIVNWDDNNDNNDRCIDNDDSGAHYDSNASYEACNDNPDDNNNDYIDDDDDCQNNNNDYNDNDDEDHYGSCYYNYDYKGYDEYNDYNNVFGQDYDDDDEKVETIDAEWPGFTPCARLPTGKGDSDKKWARTNFWRFLEWR